MQEGEQLPEPLQITQVYFNVKGNAQCLDSCGYDLEDLKAKMQIEVPAIILNKTSTILIEPSCNAVVDECGNIEITLLDSISEGDYEQF